MHFTQKISLFILCLTLLSCKKEFSNIISKSTATADASYQNSGPETLLDSIPQTMWNSGSRGEHWINFNFKDPIEVKKISFAINVDTVAEMNYSILAKESGSTNFNNLTTNTVTAHNCDSFMVENHLKNISDIRIIMSNQATWVSIRDVKIIGY